MKPEIKEVYVMDIYYIDSGMYDTYSCLADAAVSLGITTNELSRHIKNKKSFKAGNFNHRYFASYEEADLWLLEPYDIYK